ncbi:uncharacterized protein LOC128549622 [Mercenaria mercenaria]|uniref:uncharacterized protein LOC128549622 n=1 Tax=Mercenaria mercenaria TaxID=6596 RepID=UPI00234EAF85|nr:uncharacterized protein LOC128549622 [Mercenaria mercenaria]XP_053382702.1 uncharacterized protein LOC128549622 [Mercenaria mercenaria]
MSIRSVEKPLPSYLDSNFSLISHSSSVDSLDYSDEGFVFDDEITPTEVKMTDSLEDNTANKAKNMGNSEATKDSLEDKVNGENGTEQKQTASTKNEAEEHVQKKEQKQTKSKIPKSKTFDTSSSVFNNKSPGFKFQDDIPGGSNRNHVFMTSQECMVVPGCSKLPRETIASRLRFEKQHSQDKGASQSNMNSPGGDGYHRGCFPDGYQTPSQRKDLLIRDLRRQVREIKITCEEKDREISMYKQHVDEETSKLVQAKDEELERLREELKQVKQSYDDISNFCEESVTAATVLERKATDLKSAMDDREKQHQKIYLEMYRKGQDSARFEREEELERLASAGGCKVTISELVKKLAWTELELAKWQTIRRQESYHDAMRPETEAETILRFLKDSFFHYITDEKDSDHHLRAMVKIFKYTEPQMKKIRESKLIENLEKRTRKKTKRR